MFSSVSFRKSLLHIALAIALFTAVIFSVYYYLLSYTKSGESVEVPDLAGLDIVEAEAALKQLHLQYQVVDSLYLPGKRGGEIVDQEPIATSVVKTERKIFLTVSRYKSPMIKFPNVLDQTLPLAIAKLTSYGFKVGDLIYKPSDCKDCVVDVQIRGKSIEPGTNIPKGKSVNIVVGQGFTNEIVGVPVLYGLKIPEAQKVLHLQGLNLGATIFDLEMQTRQDSMASVIYRQSPAPSEEKSIPSGSSVDVYLSSDLSKVPPVHVDSLKLPAQ